jgi:hypothetical protein
MRFRGAGHGKRAYRSEAVSSRNDLCDRSTSIEDIVTPPAFARPPPQAHRAPTPPLPPLPRAMLMLKRLPAIPVREPPDIAASCEHRDMRTEHSFGAANITNVGACPTQARAAQSTRRWRRSRRVGGAFGPA